MLSHLSQVGAKRALHPAQRHQFRSEMDKVLRSTCQVYLLLLALILTQVLLNVFTEQTPVAHPQVFSSLPK